MMNKKEKYIIYGIFMQAYILLLIFNLLNWSQWFIDNIVAMALLTFILFINKWLKLGKIGFLLFNIALLAHNLGTFGFYGWSWSVFAYDNIVHFLNSTVAAYIIFNFVARKLHIKSNKRRKHTVIDEHKVVFVFLVIASVAMLGTVVELIEYGGFRYLGPGEGILFVGLGDSGSGGDAAGQYFDTMEDILVNIIGSVTGVLLYYHIKYKKKPWLKY